MSRVVIHELIDIIGHQRAAYLRHMTEGWPPQVRARRRQRCFGVWSVVGSTGPWPAVVNMWEYESWADLAHHFDHETTADPATHQDEDLAAWWAEAAAMRRGGVDRIMVAADWSPSIDDLCGAGVRGVAYAHELVRCAPGGAGELLSAAGETGRDAYGEVGWLTVGGYCRAMAADDELLLLWAIPDWATWAAAEDGLSRGVGPVWDWRQGVAPLVRSWERLLLVDAARAPLRTGRQP